jgi:GT2 family glycosyltransferase
MQAWLEHTVSTVCQQAPLAIYQADPPSLRSGLALIVCTYERPASLKRFLDSLASQNYKLDQLIIVDSSPNDDTDQMLKQHRGVEALATQFLYFHVSAPLCGLTRQRNFALRWATTDLVAFFDDDILLLPGCLHEMETVHRAAGDQVVGVGAFMQDHHGAPRRRLWYVRRLLGMLPDLQPGRYHRSGISVPWIFLEPTNDIVEGDWLPGCAMMWKTAVARESGFYEGFDGYAHGEDLDFSLRVRGRGKLVLAGAARVIHMLEPHGRPGPFRFGYMALYNKYQIHRRVLPDRTWRDVAWFIYAWTVDSMLLTRHFFSPGKRIASLQQIAGRIVAVYDILCGR